MRLPGDHAVYKRYALVWLALIVLLMLTLGSAYVPLGRGNLVVSLAIASLKAALVLLVFMRLRHGAAIWRLAAAVALFTLVLMFALSGTDFLTRVRHPAAWQTPGEIKPLIGEVPRPATASPD